MHEDTSEECNVAEFCNLIERLGTATCVLQHDDLVSLAKVEKVLHRLLRSRYDQVTQSACRGKKPLLAAYMSDGWSTDIKVTRSIAAGHKFFKRVSKTRAEFLAEKLLVRTFADSGDVATAILLWPATPLAGKCGIDVFAASLNRPFVPRLQTSITVSVYLQDGQHQASFLRNHKARHRHVHQLRAEVEGAGAVAESATDWVCGMRCLAHVGSSAMKWGLAGVVTEQILEDCHLAVAGCRNSADGLHSQIKLFVATCTRYEYTGDEDVLWQVFWQALGVPPDLIQWLMEVNPHWHAHRQVLIVRDQVRHADDPLMAVHDRVSFMLKWKSFSDSRWASIGPSSRLMLLSLVAGVEQVIALLNRNGKNNQRYS